MKKKIERCGVCIGPAGSRAENLPTGGKICKPCADWYADPRNLGQRPPWDPRAQDSLKAAHLI